MTIEAIIKRVRWCLDEEAANIAQISGIGNDDDGYMDKIIKDKIPDALRWCALYAPDGLLHSDKESSTPPTALDSAFLNEVSLTPTTSGSSGCDTFVLPADFGRLERVRLEGWKKAVRYAIEEDSDEYLMVDADTAKATLDRPVAALIRTSPNMKLECWPSGEGSAGSTAVTLTYVCVPDTDYSSSTTSTDVNVPGKMESAFIYYIAFLVATAYRDSIANSLLQIAKMHLGLS